MGESLGRWFEYLDDEDACCPAFPVCEEMSYETRGWSALERPEVLYAFRRAPGKRNRF
jgi:hypothetical protein